MNDESKEILSKAISDVGYWQWWDEVEGDVMVEFGGVLLYDESKKGKKPRSSTLALCYYNNAFLIYLDNDTIPKWYDLLHEDAIDPPTLDPDGFIFDDKAYAIELLGRFKKRHGPFSSEAEARETIENAKNILAATCGDYGFIIGGDITTVYNRNGEYSDTDIKRLSKKWWEYWKDYWNKRGTKDAYDSDYACEVTIPCK
jgi:hypothetical protein